MLIIHRIKSHWPTGRLTQVAKVRPSHVDLWLSRYHFGSASRNLFISCIKEIFALALRDRIIAASPAAHLRYTKRQKRIRATPSFEDFKGIVETIRSQKYNGHDPQESADFVEFLGLAGLGKAEAAALRQSDIDWQRETITTFRPKTKSGFAIPIYPQLKPLLLRRRRDDAPNERLFKINDAKEAIANACRRLNLSHYSHLSFRRMFITRAIERGVDVARLGWIAAQIDLLSRFCKALFAQLRESPILGAKTQSAFHPHAPQTLSLVRVRNP